MLDLGAYDTPLDSSFIEQTLGLQAFAEYFRQITGCVYVTMEKQFYICNPKNGLWEQLSPEVMISKISEEILDLARGEEIKDEFLNINDTPQYEQLDFEIESRLEDDDFREALALILTTGIGEILAQKDKLSRYMERFETG